MTCPNCQAATPDRSRFCNQCGTPLVVACQTCSTENVATSRYCAQCGQPLAASRPRFGRERLSPFGRTSAALDGRLARSPILGDEQRRVVTVLFADIVGFTSLAERLDPEEVRDVTAACFGRLVEEIVRRGGTVDKFIGDAVMALFGTPIAHEDDPSRAVEAALAMQAALGEIDGELERDHGLRLELRIGVNTGEVVAGVREIGGFQDGTVIGDTVNTASRLQTAAPPGAVLVGEMTARLARHLFELERMPPLTLRGKAAPVQAFRAVGVLDTIPVADASSLPIFGRDAELAALVDRVERLERGEGGVVVVTGEPGSGKSRLLAELKRLVELRPGIRFGEAHVTPYGPGQTVRVYESWAWAYFAEELTELAAARAVDPNGPVGPNGDGAAVTVEAVVVDALARLRARLEQIDALEALPFLCFLLDLPRPAASAHLEELSPEELHRQSLRAISKLHSRLAAERPCIIVMDDLHWAGPTILHFMESAAELAAGAPMLLVLSFRADVDAPSWALREHARRVAGDRYVELRLGPLAPTASLNLARALLGGSTLDARAEAMLLERIDGNPLYAHELIQTLVDRGALVLDDGRVQLDEGAARRIPETLQATILARIDRLPEEARRVVQIGAVLGRTFSRQLLGRVFGDGPGLERGLREAVRAGVLLKRANPARPGYTFAQGLVQEVAEQTLLIRRRRELHRQALVAIEAIFPDDLSGHAQGLARHAFAAEEWLAASRYALLAAERAATEYATREALRFYDLGLDAVGHLAGTAPQIVQCELLSGRARMLGNLGQYPESIKSLEIALMVARSPSFVAEARTTGTVDPARMRARLALSLATLNMHRLDVDAASRATDEAFEVLKEGHPELGSAWALRSWILTHRSRIGEAAEAGRTALRLALLTGSFEDRARAYMVLTRPELAGEIGSSIAAYADEAVRLAREHGHDRFLLDALLSREILRQICLQPFTPDALASAREALALALRLDSLPAEGCARIILGATCVAAGLWDEAERELFSEPAQVCAVAPASIVRKVVLASLLDGRGRHDEAGQLLTSIDGDSFPHGRVWLATTLGAHHLAAGEHELARAAIARAVTAQEDVRCLACEALLGGLGSEVLAAAGDPVGALALAPRADKPRDTGFPLARLMAARGRAIAALQRQDLELAVFEARTAVPIADTTGQPYQRAQLLLLLGSALALRGTDGDHAEAVAILGEALAVFEQLGARPAMDRAAAELGRLTGGEQKVSDEDESLEPLGSHSPLTR